MADAPASPVVTALTHAWRALLLAGRFLTRWPFPAAVDAPPFLYGSAAPFYPVIGLLLGSVLAAVALAGRALGLADGAGAAVLALLVLGLWVWSTGALHLDGLADCADAWVGGLGSRERTLAIMKDPHIGAMGVVVLVLVLLAKLVALWVVLDVSAGAEGAGLWHGLWVLVGVPVLARAQILWLVLTTSAARPEGLGAALGAYLPRGPAWFAAAFGSAAVFGLIAGTGLAVALMAAAAMAWVLLGWRRSLLQRLGGYTGDGIGALVELTETLVLLAVALTLAADGGLVSAPA
ncbi:adenosylcobinamide-GDP ribazoletransferase [uncultured Thiohalocapsa sp.]|uniref:adenosylcobinamide-GDP ribazoletransferase n=1 Tax=uncultured Thiohalocapsa sp. TaxID=768990 RepID=UPI0025D771FC|nr:adenosylcobinamide-GDP ribazoletransferase [uncultured Thiohalocapsa sp.]